MVHLSLFIRFLMTTHKFDSFLVVWHIFHNIRFNMFVFAVSETTVSFVYFDFCFILEQKVW